MLKKIRSLVSNYDERFFAWLEGKSTSRSKSVNQTRQDRDGRTQVSQRGMGPKRPAPQIPDPWD